MHLCKSVGEMRLTLVGERRFHTHSTSISEDQPFPWFGAYEEYKDANRACCAPEPHISQRKDKGAHSMTGDLDSLQRSLLNGCGALSNFLSPLSFSSLHHKWK